VRVSAKRERAPDILEVREMQQLLASLGIRERAMVFLDMPAGLRRGEPIARRLGIEKRVGWHTFRHTFSTLLKSNGEDVKVVQELLRHATSKMTLDTYTQALNPAKRAAQSKVVA
jgi:integrase